MITADAREARDKQMSQQDLAAEAKAANAVDLATGLIARNIFTDADVFKLESERIFGRSWLFLCHESQIPNPGDYLTMKMGETPIIVWRRADGQIVAFINSCRHRGNPVTRNDVGNTRSFTCPYHGWCYNVSGPRSEPGALVSVPGQDSYYHNELATQSFGLVPVAQVDSYKGLVFGVLDKDAPSLASYLGDMRWALDLLLEQGDLVAVPGVVRWRMDCNWKFAADNAIGDNSHAQIAHRSAFLTFSKMFASPPPSLGKQDPGFTLLADNGHGLNARLDYGGHKLPSAQWRREKVELTQRMTPFGARVSRFNMNVFPNLFIIDRLLMIRNPVSPTCTEIRGLALFDKSAPPDIQDAERRSAFKKFGPSGWLEMEDGENWDQATLGCGIKALESFDLNYAMARGKAQWVNDGQSPPRIDTMTNEHAQMWFYQFWSEAVRARSWSELNESKSRPTEINF